MNERTPVEITIGLVAHHEFCPRRAWLEAVGEQTDTHQVAGGTARHKRSDDPSASTSTRLRAVDVVHEEWGYSGRCDAVEVAEDDMHEVIEYKATPVRKSTEVTRPMRLQLALQVAAFDSMGHEVSGQSVYFTEHKRRIEVDLTYLDFRVAREAVEATRRTLSSGTAPPPLATSTTALH